MISSPFTIRGHHLNLYAELSSLRSDPQDLARILIEGRLRDRNGNPEKQDYAQDVIGSTREEATMVAGRYRAIFTRYVELKRDDLVVITTGDRDSICQSCVIGHHCTDRGLEMAAETEHGTLQVYEQDIGDDMLSIQAFKKLGKELTERGNIDLSLEPPTVALLPLPTPDAVPIIESNMIDFEPPLQASAAYVKAVLAHWGPLQRLRY